MTPYYDRGGITIYCNDCLKVMPWLVSEGVVFDAIIADLPYGTTACSWDTIIPFESLWQNYKALIKKAGAVVLFGSQPFTSMMVASNIEWFKSEIIYKKEKPTNIFQLKNSIGRIHENIIVFSGGGAAYGSTHAMTFNPQGVAANKKIGKTYRHGSKERVLDESTDTKRFVMENSNYPTSVLEFTNEYGKKRFHPTQKPLDLLQYLARTYTNPKDLILDNTIGSGTTLLAAQNEGRRAVGIELSEDYCKIAVDRLRQPSFFSIPDKPKVNSEQLSLIEVT